MARNLLQRVVSLRRHTVADVPVLYVSDPGRIAFLEIGFMLGFLQSNDVISSLQIMLLDLQRQALSPDAGNPQGTQGVDGKWAHGANIVDTFVERQAARKRLPRQGMVSSHSVEEQFGKTTAIVIAGTQKQEFRH